MPIDGVSAILAFTLALFFAKSYRVMPSSYLLGLHTGLVLIGSSYLLSALLAFFLLAPLRFTTVILATMGYAFAALSYSYLGSEESQTTQQKGLVAISTLAVAVMLIMSMLLTTVAPAAAEGVIVQSFRTANLVFVSAILAHIARLLHIGQPRLVFVASAFGFFWLSEYSLLIWSLDVSLTALAFSYFARLAALGMLAYVVYRSFGKGVGTSEGK